MPNERRERRAAAIQLLRECFREKSRLQVIHYSCESLDGAGRVTAIAVRPYSSSQDRLFSINSAAQRAGLVPTTPSQLDECEREMLKEFFEYAAGLPSDSRWLHWNMRDGNYGFAALEHRHTVLGGTPFRIPDDAKIDLPMVLKDIYGPVVVPHPRLENLVELNQLSRLGWLSGAEEAEAFQRGEYGRVDRATLKQVDLITELAERASGGSLKTKATWHDQYGTGVRGLYDALMDNPVWLLAYLASVPATLFATWLAVWQFYASRYFVPALTPSTTSRTLYA